MDLRKEFPDGLQNGIRRRLVQLKFIKRGASSPPRFRFQFQDWPEFAVEKPLHRGRIGKLTDHRRVRVPPHEPLQEGDCVCDRKTGNWTRRFAMEMDHLARHGGILSQKNYFRKINFKN